MFEIPSPRVLLTGLVLLAPSLTQAQTPAPPGYGPAAPPMQGFPPPPPDFSAPPGFMGPGGYDFQPPPAFPIPPDMSAPGRGMPGRSGGPLPLKQSVTSEGYVLEIPLEGFKAEEIQVDVEGRSLRISRDTSTRTSREDNFDEGRGYQRSYSFSSGRASRRLPLPPDADGAALQRQDSADQVRILIPRRQGR